MKFNFENAKEKAKKVVKNTAFGVAATFGVMNGPSAEAQETATPVSPTFNKESVIQATQDATINPESVNFIIEKKKLDLEQQQKELNAMAETYQSLHAKVASEIKGKKTKEEFNTTQNLTQKIKEFIDYYKKMKPEANLSDQRIQNAILSDLGAFENPYTGAAYNFVQQGVNQQVGDNILRTGQTTTENMSVHNGIKLTVDNFAKKYANILQLQQEINDLENLQK